MNANSILKKLGAGTLLTAVLLGGASCGEVGQGTGGISLESICPSDIAAVAYLDHDADGGTPPVYPIVPGSTIGRASIVATKEVVARTEFGNDTILDGNGANFEVPASGAPIYVNTIASTGIGTSESAILAGPIGEPAETLPTVFFTNEDGRLDVDLYFNITAAVTSGDFTFNVAFRPETGGPTVNCDITFTVSQPPTE